MTYWAGKEKQWISPNLRVLFCVKVFWYILNGTLVPCEYVITQAPAVEIYSFYKNDNREIKIILK